MGDKVRVRFPSLELFAAQSGGFLANGGRPLTNDERRIAAGVFGHSINPDAVRIAEASIANAPTTLGNTIRVQPGQVMPMSVLVHELTHIWQFQTKGTAYISDSLWHQAAAAITTGDRNNAYTVTIVPDQSIHRYEAEHQAVIVEKFYARRDGYDTNPDVLGMMDEVRRARPLPMTQIMEEAYYGPGGGRADRMLEGGGGRERPPQVTPIFRIEF